MKEKKIKIHVIDPAQDFVDVWRLFKLSLETEKWEYPSLHETHEDEVRADLARYVLQNPYFFGMMIRHGKKPIGQIIGNAQQRNLGLPKNFFFIYNFYIDPEYRKAGHMKALWNEFKEELRKHGIYHFEAAVFSNLKGVLEQITSQEVRVLSYRMGGRI